MRHIEYGHWGIGSRHIHPFLAGNEMPFLGGSYSKEDKPKNAIEVIRNVIIRKEQIDRLVAAISRAAEEEESKEFAEPLQQPLAQFQADGQLEPLLRSVVELADSHLKTATREQLSMSREFFSEIAVSSLLKQELNEVLKTTIGVSYAGPGKNKYQHLGGWICEGAIRIIDKEFMVRR